MGSPPISRACLGPFDELFISVTSMHFPTLEFPSVLKYFLPLLRYHLHVVLIILPFKLRNTLLPLVLKDTDREAAALGSAAPTVCVHSVAKSTDGSSSPEREWHPDTPRASAGDAVCILWGLALGLTFCAAPMTSLSTPVLLGQSQSLLHGRVERIPKTPQRSSLQIIS